MVHLATSFFSIADIARGRKSAIEANPQREFFVEVHQTKGCFLFFSSYNCCWCEVEEMAYRGQGQKVQKVMVQPIVSFLTRKAGIGGLMCCYIALSAKLTWFN